MGCYSQEEGCAPGRGGGGGLHGGGNGETGRGGGEPGWEVGPLDRTALTSAPSDQGLSGSGAEAQGDQKLYVIFSYTRDPLQSRWFQSPEEKSRSAGMHEKPELGKSGKNCLYSRLAFKQTQVLFPFCWLWAQEPYETQTTLKEATLGIAASSRTKALGLQGSVLKPKLHGNYENLKYSTCTQNQKVEKNVIQ